MAKSIDRKRIAVYAHWQELAAPELMGELLTTPVRGQEVFSFAYELAGHSAYPTAGVGIAALHRAAVPG